MVEVERDLRMSSGPTSCAQAGPPRPNRPGPFPDGFWKLATSVSAWWPSQWQFPDVQGEIPVSVCAHSLWSSHWPPVEWAWLCPLCTLPSGIYTHWWDPSGPSLLLNSHSSEHFLTGEMHRYLHHLHGPSLKSLLYWGVQDWTQHSRSGLTSAEQIGRIISFNLLATPLLMQPRIPFTFLVLSVLCWLMIHLVSSRTLRCFSAKLFPRWKALSTDWCLRLFFTKCRTLHFLLNFMTFQPISPACCGLSGWQHNPLA